MSRATDKTLLEEMLTRHTFTHAVLKQATREILDIIREGLVKDGVVTISKFGSFRLKPVAARRGVNPQTGAALTIAAHQRVIFSPCKALRELIEPNHQPPIPLEPESPASAVTTAAEPTVEGKETPVVAAFATSTSAVVHSVEDQQINEPAVSVVEEVTNSTEQKKIEEESPAQQQESEHDIDLGVFEPEKRTEQRRHALWGVLALLLVMAVIAFLLMRREVPDELSPPPVRVASVSATASSDTTPQKTPPSAEQESDVAEQQHPSPSQEEKAYFSEQHHSVSRGESLWHLAETYYHEPLLWPHIFQANRDSISNPDQIGVGAEILIPTLHGTPDQLSKEDQKSLADGYRLLYDFYKAQSRPDAFYALLMAKQYEQGTM